MYLTPMRYECLVACLHTQSKSKCRHTVESDTPALGDVSRNEATRTLDVDASVTIYRLLHDTFIDGIPAQRYDGVAAHGAKS